METYNELLDAGWRMADVDEMDFIGFVQVRAWRAKKKATPRKRCIDEVWKTRPNVK